MTGPRILHLAPDGRLTAADLRDAPALRRVFDILDRDGEQARVVGGAVRNALLGLPPGDIDVTTTATPDLVMTRAKAARLRTVPTGLAHGTVTVLVDRVPVEVTTLREDVETDGRHAVVRFGRDFEADARRRDFTVNALSMTPDGVVHDTVGGLDDLRAGRVRFIGDPDRRIREDYLRVLRFFRFGATYGLGPPDPDGLQACARHRDGVGRLSRERIRSELLKLLAAPGAARAVAAMDAAGVAAVALGGPCRPDRLAAIERADDLPPDPLLRLAALAVLAPADADRLRDALRLSNDEHNRLGRAAAARERLDPARPPGPDALLRELLLTCGPVAAQDGVALARADAPAEVEAGWAEARGRLDREPQPALPFRGSDVLARGVRNGPLVGAVLKRLQADWIRAGFPSEPAVLARLLEAAIRAETAS